MGNYLNIFGRALDNADFIKLTYQAFGILIALIVLFLLAMAIKSLVNTRIRKTGIFSMDLEDIKKMRRTGLLSEEEYNKIRSGLIKRFIKDTGEENRNPEKPGGRIPEPAISGGRDIKIPISPAPSATLATEHTPKTKPVDIDDLLKRGIITPEEFQKLSEISPKKPDQ
jgi:uncharacterized protein YutE (UPF0331/DUF86 family)